MTESFGRLALHAWTLETTPLETAIDAARRGGFDAMELRRKDFVACFERGMSRDETIALIRAGGLPVCVLGVDYGWVFATGAESRRLQDLFAESCTTAVALGCSMLMSAPGGASGPIARAVENTRAVADIAAEHGLKLALEFNSQHEVINSLEALREIVDGAGRANCGLLLDAYHLERSGGRLEDVPGEALFHVQYSDVPPGPVGDTKRPVDRLPPGQGVVPWAALFARLRALDYRGHLSYEAPNPALWARSPYDVAREGVALTRALVDEAVADMP